VTVLMDTGAHSSSRLASARRRADQRRSRRDNMRRDSLLGGETEGNERLAIITGLVLIVLLAAVGVTIVRIGQLLWLHLFLGLVVLGLVGLKLGSTGYRFIRYYTGDEAYRRKGPPAPVLRGLAPLVVFFTLAVFVTGVALLLLGPGSRNPLVLLHKVAFIAWAVLTTLHVIGHLPEIAHLLSGARRTRREVTALRSSLRAGRGMSPSSLDDVPGGVGRAMAAMLCRPPAPACRRVLAGAAIGGRWGSG
jgi:hypothetical protein